MAGGGVFGSIMASMVAGVERVAEPDLSKAKSRAV